MCIDYGQFVKSKSLINKHDFFVNVTFSNREIEKKQSNSNSITGQHKSTEIQTG